MFIIAEGILLAAFVIFSLVLACSQIKPSDAARASDILRRAFSTISGQCKLVAEIADSGGGFVVASDGPQFVGGAGARQQHIYTACMEASGFNAGGGTSGSIDNHLSTL